MVMTDDPAVSGPIHPALAEMIAGTAGYMIDVTGAYLPGLLAALGLTDRMPDVLAGYVTGTLDIDWPGGEWGKLHGKTGLFRYDQTPGLALFASGAADGADIERGAGTVGAFIDACRKREARGWWSWGYIDQTDYAGLRAEVKSAGLAKVQYGIANWNDSLAQATGQLGPEVAYVQWASPTSNPRTIVPFTGGHTLAELNVDLNATLPGWFAIQHPVPAKGLLVTDTSGSLTGRLALSTDGKTWTTAG